MKKMKKALRKTESVLLSLLLVFSTVLPGMLSFAAGPSVVITDQNGNEITDRIEVQEYRSVQLSYTLSGDVPSGAYVEWKSNLPLLADVDDSGKVTGYDYSKAAIIQLWLDENVRTIPLVGNSMASSIENTIYNSGYDLETVNTDILVALVRGIAGDSIADSLRNYLDNMNVVVTATLRSAEGNALATDSVDVLVTQSTLGSLAPTGVHITNKKSIPDVVAVGTTVQLYGAVTPVRLKQGVKWTVGSGLFDSESSKHATVDSNGLVTFTSAGKVTVRVNPESTIYGMFSDTVSFTVLNPADLPVTDFTISGETSVAEGETTQLALDGVTPAGAYTGSVVWTSSDDSIAVVDSTGRVTGLDGGSGLTFSKSVTISASIDGVTKSVTVTVTRSLISTNLSAIEISGEDTIANDTPSQYSSTVFPSRLNTNSSVVREWGLYEDGAVIWATNSVPAETELAIISSNGLLTPKASGVIEIHAKATYNGASVETSIQVVSGKAVTDFTITGSNSVTENKTVQLSVSNIEPYDYDPALLSTVKWSSANPSVASVDSNGVVSGLDAGGYGSFNSQSTTIYATISGVTKSFEITVNGAWINYITSAEIDGFDNVIKDFPVKYNAIFAPERMSISATLWGLPTDGGSAPWTASNFVTSSSNTSNSIASVDSNGVVTGKAAGSTTLYLYGRHNFTSHNEARKEINVVEVEPQSITITAPTKKTYVEGETQLDLSGMKVELTYNRAALEEYYGDTSNLFTEEQLKVSVNDYTVSEINQAVLDTEQYIVVSVVRAGRTYRGIFSITLESKKLTDIEITSPQRKYIEGVTALDLYGLTVKANYSNAASEYVSDYTVDTDMFNSELYNVEQNIRVSYTHAGRSAEAYFTVIVYGIPVVSVDTGSYTDGWTSEDVVFTLDSTNKLDGITYYYRTSSEWHEISGDSFTAFANSDTTYYFKAINSEGIESAETLGFNVKHDNVTPSFELSQQTASITNQSYDININNLNVGISGIASVTVNGSDITGNTSYTVDENGEYSFTVTANNGLSTTQSVMVDNIDKTAPTVDSVTLAHKNDSTVARIINGITFGRFFNRQIEITLEASDEGVAGIERIEYRFLDENGLPAGSEWFVYNSGEKPVQDPEFKGYVQVRAIDRAGNVSEYLCSDGYVIDEDKPTDVSVTASCNGSVYTDVAWVANDVVIELDSYAFSGIYEYLYRVDGGEWQSVNGNSLTVSAQGVYLYEFMAVSNAALDSGVTSITVKIDRQVPVIRVNFVGSSGRWTGEDIEFYFSTLEQSLSGVTYYYTDGVSGWKEVESGNSLVLSESTNASYQFKAVNAAGTQSNPSDAYIVMIDSQVPEITVEQTVTAPTCVPYDLLISTLSGASGIKSVVLNGADITGLDRVTVSENGNYLFTVTGNTQKTTSYLLVIDNFYTPVFEIDGISFERAYSGGYAAIKPTGEILFNEPTVIDIAVTNTGIGTLTKTEYTLLDENGLTFAGASEYDSTDKPVIDGDFRGYVSAVAYDDLNNVTEQYRSELVTVEITAPEAPRISAVSGGNTYLSSQRTNKGITITLDSFAFSGVECYKYRVDGGAWSTLDGDSLTAVSGVHTYEFKAISNAGNESSVSQITTDYDVLLPDPTVKVADGLCAYNGQTLTIPVSIEDNPSISAYGVEIEYDSTALEINSVNIGNAFAGGIVYDIQSGTVTVVWNSDSGDKAADGVLFTLEATVLSDKTEKSYIDISALDGLTFSADYAQRTLICEGADVSLNPLSSVCKVSVCNLAGRTVKQISVTTGPDMTFGGIRQQADAYATPKENKSFIGWRDGSGNMMDDSTLIFRDVSVYPVYEDTVILEGAYIVERNANGGSYIKGLLSEGTSANEIRDYLGNDSSQILIYKDGALLGGNELVGTGCVVKCVSSLDASVVYDEATVILKGDVDGDGMPTETDYDILFGTLRGAGELSGVQFLAADIDGDGAADAFDAFYINKYLTHHGELPLY